MSMQADAKTTLINLTIDGMAVSVPKGTTVYQAALQIGIKLPIFCYMDRMPPFGACRMCLVEVEKMNRLQTSCTLEVAEGMVVKTLSEAAVSGREEILEFLLINHPLDCPICDRGGECPLQEHTFSHGPGKSRFFEEKRHFKKPWPLGPVLMLDRERCIQCARCTRFGDLVAGDHALEFIDRGYHLEVGTPDGGPAQSKFIGNTIMICPVGALTSQVYRFRARPWDNDPTPSTCTLCPVGCSFILDSRDGEIMRTRSQENREVNDVWLCDKGWFGYEFVYHENRLQKPLIRRHGKLEPSTWDEALTLVAAKLKEAKPTGKVAGLGGNPLTVEENYLFQQFMREVMEVNHVDHRVGMPIFSLEDEGLMPGMEMAIGDCRELNFAILLGLDITEEFPVIWLRLREAINKKAFVTFMGNILPEISPYLNKAVLHNPGEELEALKQHLGDIEELASKGQKGAIFVGRQYLAIPQRKAILAQLMTLRQKYPHLTLNLLEGKGNSMGARLAGMRPDCGPLGSPLSHSGLNAIQCLETAAKEGWKGLYIAGADPASKFPSKLWLEARSKTDFIVVQDLFLTETARQADVVLPTLSFIEKGGHFINIEQRVQKLLPGKDIPAGLYADGEIFALLARKMGHDLRIDPSFVEHLKLTRLPLKRPHQMSAISEQNSPLNHDQLMAIFTSHLFDHGVRMEHNTRLVKLAPEPRARLHPEQAEKRGIKQGDKVRLIAHGIEIGAKIDIDKNIAKQTVALPLGFPEVPVHEFEANLLNGLIIEIQKDGS